MPRGIYNVTSPNPVRNREFARALGRTLHRPAFMPVPAFALRTLFGRGLADEALLGGQRAVPSLVLNAMASRSRTQRSRSRCCISLRDPELVERRRPACYGEASSPRRIRGSS